MNIIPHICFVPLINVKHYQGGAVFNVLQHHCMNMGNRIKVI